ncbi:MAG: hypothetical protein CVV27_12125 [Candidatus Melainabacteria bacterium HGW-Melainabacteria-1]|nr:MAG: hypothetical protein CVV27_12125 [Candidatus Melainabacteria bacterium HGW-Melainabacteria-1]
MKKQQYRWVLLTLGLAVSVGCTVPFLVNTRDNAGTVVSGQVITEPNAAASTLPIFLPQPGASTPPLTLSPPGSGPFGAIASGNPAISGPLPAPTATPFLPNLAPNIDNQISFNPLPVLTASGGLTSTLPIVKSIIKGRVLGWNTSLERFEALTNAQVRIDGSLSLSTDANGYYTTTQEFDKAVTISAGHDNFIASTVTDVPPGVSRDIHLNPLNERPVYAQNTFPINGSITNLAQNGRRPVVVFTDGHQSVASAAIPDAASGRYSLDVRMKVSRPTTSGTLFASVLQDVGKLATITQYGYSPSVQVPVPPPQPVPTATPSTASGDTAIPLKSTELLLSFDHLVSPEAFGQISVNFSTEAGSRLLGSVMQVYMNFPDGGRVLVAKYNDNTSTTINQTIRVPKIANTSFTVVAHSGSSQYGSDIVVPNLQIGSTVTRTFLAPPQFSQLGDETDFTNPNKTHFKISDTTPNIGWASQSNVNSYQLDVQGEFPESFRWEAYTLGTSLTYPDFGEDHPLSLKLGQTYRLQLLASDFDIGTFNILSQGESQTWRQPSRLEQAYGKQVDGSFGIKLLNPTIRNFAQGYRIAYNSLSFLTD